MTAASPRLTFQAWLQLGLEALAEDGPEALTVEALCTRAKRTRGSFYHHFPSIEYFIEHMLEAWRKTHTEDLIKATAQRANLADRMGHLNELAIGLDPGIEQGVRRLAARDETARNICAAVDDTRVAYLADLYARSARFSAQDALTMAKVEYAAFVGMQVIYPGESPAKRLALHDEFVRLTR
ncbi:MAG: TetR/AcrR family transcriptional regulator [Fimbriimonadaceae bacterium]|nr:TetR/AcrR family transcriptional regulator [Alphaproteobacteria bacterium]